MSNVLKKIVLGSRGTASGELLRVGSRFMITGPVCHQKRVIANYTSDEAHNGEYYTVRNMFAYDSHYKTTSTVDVIMRNFESPRTHYVFVDTHEGKRFCIHRDYVDPHINIDPSYAATVNKLQGSECDHIVCYLPAGIGSKRCWTRAHLHVIIIRARKSLTFFANTSDIEKMASHVSPSRVTAMDVILPQLAEHVKDVTLVEKDLASLTFDL